MQEILVVVVSGIDVGVVGVVTVTDVVVVVEGVDVGVVGVVTVTDVVVVVEGVEVVVVGVVTGTVGSTVAVALCDTATQRHPILVRTARFIHNRIPTNTFNTTLHLSIRYQYGT